MYSLNIDCFLNFFYQQTLQACLDKDFTSH